MPFIDRVKAGAAQAAHKAQEAAKAGQAKIDQVQAKREQDAMFRDLGAAVYAQHSGSGDTSTSAEIDRLLVALKEHEEAQAAAAEAAAADTAPPATGQETAPPVTGKQTAGDFKLDD
ncbi:MAG: hypothetical protein ABSC73_02525 [Acidimicrobiales bacterium]|jgi:hypothetical protein